MAEVNVVQLRTCRCGEPGKPVRVEGEGCTVTGYVCDACLAKSEGVLSKMRPIFDMMIACGVPRELANSTMTFLLERYEEPQ